MGRLGVPRLILTNAAGGISPKCARGALMVIDDHINLIGQNPLVGPNDDRFGLRFPDMTYVYSPRLRAIADEAAKAIGVPIQHGVYIAVLGPSYETPAEIRAFAPSAPTPSACRPCRKPLPRGTWASKCSGSRASPMPPPACFPNRSIIRK